MQIGKIITAVLLRKKKSHNNGFQVITFDEIKSMILEKEEYSRNIEEVKNIYNKENKENKDNKDIIRVSNILGIGPEPIKSPIYKHLVNYDNILDEDIRNFNNTENLMGLLNVIAMSLLQQYEEGMLVTVPPKTSVMRQTPGKYYYRGENDVYPVSGPSIYRKQKKIEKYKRIPKKVRDLVNDLMMEELNAFLLQFDSVNNWGYSTINVYAIAQHYGINTKMLDITSNIKTALFFMACMEKNGEWVPFTKKEIKEKRYGVLFRSPSELTILNRVLNKDNKYETILPIGYQPFMRCSTQYGYFIASMNSDFNLCNHPLFERYKVELTEDFCNWIYYEMDKGNRIYPNEDVPDISQYIKKIEQTHQFSKKTFDNVLERCELKPLKNIIQKDLVKCGYSISDMGKKYISNHRLKEINKIYTPERVRGYMKTDLKIQPKVVVGSDLLINDNGEIVME